MKKLLLVLFIAILLSPVKSFGLDRLPGKYELVGDIKNALGKDRVTMIEFFNFSCGHCYKFLSTFPRTQQKFGNKLVHKKIPIYWGKQTPFPAIAYYLAEEKGKGEEVLHSIFDANFQGGAQIFDPRVVNFIMSESGISADVRNQNDLNAKVTEGIRLAFKYQANETPTIILNDVIKVTPRIVGGDVGKMTENLDLIISKLLSSK